MSDSSKTQVRVYRETTWGEDPSTANKMTDLNVTSESLTQQTNVVRSANIRADGNTPSVNRTGITASGDIGVEMNYGDGLNLLFEGCLRSTFGTDVGVAAATTVAAVATGNKLTDSANGFVNVQVGQWINVTGFATDANNGYFRVIAKVSDGEIDVEGGILVDEAAGPAVTVKGSLLKNETTDQSFLVEVERSDINIFKYFTGMRVGQAQFNFAPNSLVTGSFSLRGKQEQTATVTQGDGAPNAAATTRSMNAVDNIQGVFEDGSASPLCITNFTFTISPALRDQACIGSLPLSGIGSGTQTAQITIEAYLEDNTGLDDYLNFEQKKLALVIEDVEGNAYVFDFPSTVPSTGEDPTGGLDQDVLQRFTFEAFLNTDLGATVGITKIDA